jgi:hypothetical protein
MARQKTNNLSGKVANVIFYEFRGIPCARSSPVKVRQTKATKASAEQFGKAVSIASMLRSGLHTLLPDVKDKDMMYRFNNALLQWLRSSKTDKSTIATELPFINEFQFNEKSALDTRLKLPLTIDWKTPGKIILTIPRLNPERLIVAPADTQTVNWQIRVTGCTLDIGKFTGNYSTGFDMEYGSSFIPAQQVQLPFVIKPASITVVAVGLKYTATKKGTFQVIEDKRWLPAGIVGACYGKPV